MAIHQRMVMMILALMCQWACTQGLSFQNCDKEKVAELNLDDTNLNKTFTCVGISNNTVIWWQLEKEKQDLIPAGVCLPFDGTVKSCDTRSSNLDGAVFIERRSSSESTMTIHVSSVQRTLQNATLLCQPFSGRTATCPLDLIRPASGTCYAELDTESSREWSVRVRCNITRGFSTRGRYKCLLSQESPRKRDVADIRMTNTDRLPQGTAAVCDHRFEINTTDTGHHHYSVQLTPGRTNVTIPGDITIERPEVPQIFQCQPNLDEGMVPENQTLTCQCQAESLGKPGGVLKWSTKDRSGTIVVRDEGEKGQSNLPFSTALTRHNHTTKLRCGVQWGTEFNKSSIELRVGYPPSQVLLNINSGNSVVAEKSSATFKCWATDGRPSPTLTLRGTGSGAEQRTGQASLTYDWPNVRCEDSGNYTCTASNGMGPDKTVTSVLNVTCGPQGFSRQIPPFLYQGEEIQFTFDLVANPPPFKVTFLFLGSLEANSTSKVKGIVLSGGCERKGETRVHATCTVTVSNVTSSGAAGLYRGSLTNGHGSLDFDFEVKLNATMGPDSPSDVALVAAAVLGVIAAFVVILVVVILVKRHARKGSSETMTLKDAKDTDGVKYSVVAATTEANGSDGADSSSEVDEHVRLTSGTTMNQPLLSAAEDPADSLHANVGQEDAAAAATASATAKPPPMEEVSYAVVQKKPQKAGPAAALQPRHSQGPESRGPANEAKENVYSVVDKKRKRPKPQPKKEEEKAVSGGTVDSKADPHRPESATEDHVYGNINVLNQMDNGAENNAASLAPESADAGREVNADGLLYVSVDFNNQASAFPPPPPSDQGDVLYSAVDFSRTAPTQ